MRHDDGDGEDGSDDKDNDLGALNMEIMKDTFDDLGFLLPTILVDGTTRRPTVSNISAAFREFAAATPIIKRSHHRRLPLHARPSGEWRTLLCYGRLQEKR